VHAGVVPLARTLEAELLAGVSDADRTRLREALARLAARAEAIGTAAGEGLD